MRHRMAVLLILLVLCMSFCAGAAGLTPTDAWQPPDLSAVDPEAEPYLLVLRIAQEELGYVEGPLPDESKYGLWFGHARAAWCSEFLSWCVQQADDRYGTHLMHSVYPYYGKTREGFPYFIEHGRFISDTGKLPTGEKQWLIGEDDYMASNGYVPHPGDYMWVYYYDRTLGPDHVTIVEGVSQDAAGEVMVHVIEGNNPDRVQRSIYPLNHKSIFGFGTPVKRAHANLRKYRSGDDATALMQQLGALGYLEADHWERQRAIDKKVEAAIMQLQRDHDLRITGILDIASRKALEQALDAAGIPR